MLTVDPIAGRVWGPNIEYCKPSGIDNYVYVPIYVNGRSRGFKRSHIVWWAFHHRWPKILIDHWNRVRYDDRVSNLREATDHENVTNTVFNRRIAPNRFEATQEVIDRVNAFFS